MKSGYHSGIRFFEIIPPKSVQTLKNQTLKILSESTGDILTTLLKNRGLSAETLFDPIFRAPTLEHLHDPFLFPGMENAVSRILEAKEKKERVVIFGDYDVDGVSSTAMLVRFLSELGIEVSYRLPHRVHDGYGMKSYFMDELAEKQVKLVISVDCGTRDLAVISHAKSLGIDIIITDHHAVPEVIPENAIALLNPKLPGTTYPFHFLSGSGVAFKFLQAIALRYYPEKKAKETMMNYIDFATLGTIADMMPLVGENRSIVILGLAQMKKSRSSGLMKLIEGRDIGADIVGFHIGPRINAAGRMDSPYKALSLLLAGEDRVDDLLEEIETLNTKRKASTEHFLRHAMEITKPGAEVIFYESDDIEHGIIGLIAGRLVEAFGKPAIALKREDSKLVASCRAPEGFDMVEFLTTFKDRFVSFGGHKQAAGFTIAAENFEAFKQEAITHAAALHIETPIQKSPLQVDAIVPLRELTIEAIQSIHALAPYGIGFAKPLFIITDISGNIEDLGKDGKHLRIKTDYDDLKINLFGFGEHKAALRSEKKFSLVAEVSEETWMRKKYRVLTVRDVIID